jgi:phosphatidylglycerophosphatase C
MSKPTIAAFDFDGTVAAGDAVVPFITRVTGRVPTLRAFASIAPLARFRNRDLLKERFLAETVKGLSEDQLNAAGVAFARHWQVSKVRPPMMERVDWHREQGHRLVIISASLDVYLKPLGQMLGFDDVICTQLEFVDGIATGRIIGGNMRSANKAHALNDLVDDRDMEIWAYGNSAGDIAMLTRADRAFWVTRSGEIRPWTSDRSAISA